MEKLEALSSRSDQILQEPGGRHEEFLKPLGVSQNRLGREIKVPPRRVNEIVLGKRSITPDTALHLARYFGTSERFWLGLQMDFDLEEARRNFAERIDREVKPAAFAA